MSYSISEIKSSLFLSNKKKFGQNLKIQAWTSFDLNNLKNASSKHSLWKQPQIKALIMTGKMRYEVEVKLILIRGVQKNQVLPCNYQFSKTF